MKKKTALIMVGRISTVGGQQYHVKIWFEHRKCISTLHFAEKLAPKKKEDDCKRHISWGIGNTSKNLKDASL
jgi:hypothetical protein